MSTLYVVATPIGNLEDMTPRAVRILGEVPVVAAEDTRMARVLLTHFGIHGRRLVSYNEYNRERRIPEIVTALGAGDVALVTDAGTPAISDPGSGFVAAARAAGHTVIAVPGASAVVAALSVAGLQAARFRFAGFLPRSAGDLRRLLEEHSTRPEALVAFESPQRLKATLAVIAEVLPDARIAVCRELTKLHEEVFAGTPAEALAHFDSPRGEIVLVLEAGEQQPKAATDDAQLRDEVQEMRALGLTRAQASALLASRHGIGRRQVYALWLEAEG